MAQYRSHRQTRTEERCLYVVWDETIPEAASQSSVAEPEAPEEFEHPEERDR
jgi:hypothetical protein